MAEFRDEDGTTRLRGDFSGPIVVDSAHPLSIRGTDGTPGGEFSATTDQIDGVSLVASDHGKLAAVIISGPDESVGLLAHAVLFRFANAAPADVQLSNGGFALWLDQTNGAGKLMVKAKTQDGTVVTGSLNLS